MTNTNKQVSSTIYDGIFDSLKHIKNVPENIKFWSDDSEFYTTLFNREKEWTKVINILGNTKGVISSEDRQLLKIVLNLSDKEVDKLISDYKIEYNNHVKSSRPWGNEKWR